MTKHMSHGWQIMGVAMAFMCLAGFSGAAEAKVRLKPAVLVKLYKERCLSNVKELRGTLSSGKIKVRETGKPAAKSEQIACPFEAKNPTMVQLNNKKWIGDTEAFINKVGIEAYITGANQSMNQIIIDAKVHQVLERSRRDGLTELELAMLGNLMRAVAFTQAHILAAKGAAAK